MQTKMLDTKVCTKCSESKQLSDFGKRRSSKDGLQPACRECLNIQKRSHYSSNKDKILTRNKAWLEANPDKIAAYRKDYYEANRAKKSAYSKAYYEANREDLAAYKKDWAEANREDLAAYNKAWVEANPDRTAAIGGKGLAVARGGAASGIYDLELCIPFYAESRRLSKETGVAHHVDHIIPITKGGLHCQTNLQVLTAVENIQKGDSL